MERPHVRGTRPGARARLRLTRSPGAREPYVGSVGMPPDASTTRNKLIDEAARAFAEHGVYGASLIDITRRAGQRNRGALHYHFGSRAGVLCAVLDRHVDFLARREGELLQKALAAPDDDVKSVVEAIVRPATELAESGWRGRCFLVILAELIEDDPDNLDPDVATE